MKNYVIPSKTSLDTTVCRVYKKGSLVYLRGDFRYSCNAAKKMYVVMSNEKCANSKEYIYMHAVPNYYCEVAAGFDFYRLDNLFEYDVCKFVWHEQIKEGYVRYSTVLSGFCLFDQDELREYPLYECSGIKIIGDMFLGSYEGIMNKEKGRTEISEKADVEKHAHEEPPQQEEEKPAPGSEEALPKCTLHLGVCVDRGDAPPSYGFILSCGETEKAFSGVLRTGLSPAQIYIESLSMALSQLTKHADVTVVMKESSAIEKALLGNELKKWCENSWVKENGDVVKNKDSWNRLFASALPHKLSFGKPDEALMYCEQLAQAA